MAAAGPGPPAAGGRRRARAARRRRPAGRGGRAAGRLSARAAGRRARGRQRHVRDPARRHRAPAGASPSSAARASTASGVAPDGRTVRFPALGRDHRRLGRRLRRRAGALAAAARGEDGRGPRTALERAVPEHFGLATPHGARRGDPPRRGSRAARGRAGPGRARRARAAMRSRREIVDRLAAEVVAFARAALTRLGLEGEPVDVVLGGGLLRAGTARLAGRSIAGPRGGRRRRSRRASCAEPPIVGAALLGARRARRGRRRRPAAPRAGRRGGPARSWRPRER